MIGVSIPSSATLLFNRPIRALLPKIGRAPININKDDVYYKALKSRQETYIKNTYTCKHSAFFSAGSKVGVQREDGSPWIHAVIIEGHSNDHQG